MKTTKILFGILAVTMALAVPVQAQSFLTNGLVAYYPFSGNANDASGNGNNGTNFGNDLKFSLDRFGQQQRALFLNTTSTPAYNLDGAYVAIPRAAGLDFNGDFTLSGWVNLSVISGTLPENLISNGPDNSSMNLRIEVDPPGHAGYDFLQFIGGGAGSDFYVFLPQVRNAWWQTTIVRSGTNVSMFKNGSLLTNGMMSTTVNGSAIWLGKHVDGGGNGSWYPLVGGIDDVRIYNRALSVSEVQQLYDYESGPRVNLILAVKPSFTNLTLGTNYQLQISSDLSSWTNFGSPFTPTNTVMDSTNYFDTDVWGKLFFRLQAVP